MDPYSSFHFFIRSAGLIDVPARFRTQDVWPGSRAYHQPCFLRSLQALLISSNVGDSCLIDNFWLKCFRFGTARTNAIAAEVSAWLQQSSWHGRTWLRLDDLVGPRNVREPQETRSWYDRWSTRRGDKIDKNHYVALNVVSCTLMPDDLLLNKTSSRGNDELLMWQGHDGDQWSLDVPEFQKLIRSGADRQQGISIQ